MINHLKSKSLIILCLLLGSLILVSIVLATSSNFLQRATEAYQRFCTRRNISLQNAISCYAFDKLSELESRLDLTEGNNATQSAKIAELEERIAALENPPSPSPSPSTTYLISDNTWKFSNTEISGWLNASFDDSSWITTQAPSGGQCSSSAIGLLINEHGALPMSVSDPNWAGGTGYFRKTFNLGSIPSTASVRVVLDDDGDLYINGNLVLSDHDNHVAGIQQANIPTSDLVSGTNAIGLKVIDSAGGCQHAQLEITINP